MSPAVPSQPPLGHHHPTAILLAGFDGHRNVEVHYSAKRAKTLASNEPGHTHLTELFSMLKKRRRANEARLPLIIGGSCYWLIVHLGEHRLQFPAIRQGKPNKVLAFRQARNIKAVSVYVSFLLFLAKHINNGEMCFNFLPELKCVRGRIRVNLNI